jgi:hypothetical protein
MIALYQKLTEKARDNDYRETQADLIEYANRSNK